MEPNKDISQQLAKALRGISETYNPKLEQLQEQAQVSKTIVGKDWFPTNSQIQAMHDQNIRLATRVGALHEALVQMVDTVIWMSGSNDFGPEGQAWVGWQKAQPKLDAAIAQLKQGDPDYVPGKTDDQQEINK